MADGVLGDRHRRPVQSFGEPPAQVEDDVADLFGLEPPQWEMAVKRVARIERPNPPEFLVMIADKPRRS